MDLERILEDYFLISIPDEKLCSPIELLSNTGMLFARSFRYRLAIISIKTESNIIGDTQTYIWVKVCAEIREFTENESYFCKSLESLGSFSQVYNYFVHQFHVFCQSHDDELFIHTGDGFA